MKILASRLVAKRRVRRRRRSVQFDPPRLAGPLRLVDQRRHGADRSPISADLRQPVRHFLCREAENPNRDARIRTGDPRHPKAVRYQAAPRPDGSSVAEAYAVEEPGSGSVAVSAVDAVSAAARKVAEIDGSAAGCRAGAEPARGPGSRGRWDRRGCGSRRRRSHRPSRRPSGRTPRPRGGSPCRGCASPSRRGPSPRPGRRRGGSPGGRGRRGRAAESTIRRAP